MRSRKSPLWISVFSKICKIFSLKINAKVNFKLFWAVLRVTWVHFLNSQARKNIWSNLVHLISNPFKFLPNYERPKKRLFFDKKSKLENIIWLEKLGRKFSTKKANKKVLLGPFKYRHPLPWKNLVLFVLWVTNKLRFMTYFIDFSPRLQECFFTLLFNIIIMWIWNFSASFVYDTKVKIMICEKKKNPINSLRINVKIIFTGSMAYICGFLRAQTIFVG